MSLIAVWKNEEQPAAPSVWAATDTRISDHGSVLIDEGGKLFSLPMLCRSAGADGFFTVPYFAQDLGLACVGATLLYQHVYSCLVPILSSLVGDGDHAPSLEDVAHTTSVVTTTYVASLGNYTPQAHHVTLVLFGYCGVHLAHEAFALRPLFEDQLFVRFEPTQLDLANGQAHFFGDCVPAASTQLDELRASRSVDIVWHRAPINVVRSFVADQAFPTIGGDVQIGFTLGSNFTRVATVAPRVIGQPAALMRLNNIDLDRIGPVGPCAVGIPGMVGV